MDQNIPANALFLCVCVIGKLAMFSITKKEDNKVVVFVQLLHSFKFNT